MNPSRGTVLLADDDELVREGLGALLQRAGFTVARAGTADEAIAALRAGTFEALVSDIHMPGNHELELVTRARDAVPAIPVVLLTGRPSIETAARSVRLPVTAYLTKPPEPDELTQLLDAAIAEYRSLRAFQVGRSRLSDWQREIERIEKEMRAGASPEGQAPMASYLRLTLRQVILMLSDLEQASAALERSPAAPLVNLDQEAALRHTVEVLERTKQNFKSRELAELRKQIEWLLRQNSPGE